jgi:hypothetical protein
MQDKSSRSAPDGGTPRKAEARPDPDTPVIPHRWRLGARLRNYFLTGLVVVGPVAITVYIAWYVINIVDRWVKPYIPGIYNPDTYLPFAVPGFGLVFAILMLTMIGALAANLLGRSLISSGEMMLDRMPIVRNLYRALKQIFESVLTVTAPQQAFQKVACFCDRRSGQADRCTQSPGRSDQRIHADGDVAAERVRLLRAAEQCHAHRNECGGRREDHHLGGHGQP